MKNCARIMLYLAVGWNGFFIMGIELLGGRLLTPFFGGSIFVWGAIITVFMLCLSIGYLFGGYLSLYNPSIFVLGLLLLSTAISALPIITWSDPLLEFLSNFTPDPRYSSFSSALLLFGVPTILAGMISPYTVRLLSPDLHQAGRFSGLVYFISTFGSAGGTILTSFYLVLYFEINTIVLSFISITAILGSILIFIATLMAAEDKKCHAIARG